MSDYLKRLAEALKKREAPMGPDAWDWQQFADASPAGSVNAPGGISQPQERDRPQRLGKLLAGASMLPGPSGDLLGPLSDAYMYAMEPESRTPGNFALSALGALPFIPSLATVFHGSPHKFDAFDMSKIGTGEGAQAYGHGLYMADAPGVAKQYVPRDPKIEDKLMSLYKQTEARQDYDALSVLEDALIHKTPTELRELYPQHGALIDQIAKIQSKAKGSLYTVDLPDEAIAKMLDWDKPLSEQAPEVRAALAPLVNDFVEKQAKDAGSWGASAAELESYRKQGREIAERKRGEEWYQKLFHQERKQVGANSGASAYAAAASERLKQSGIPGIRYLDGGSRGAGQGTSNYVVFDDRLPKILKRE
jgi:hypothetical protein